MLPEDGKTLPEQTLPALVLPLPIGPLPLPVTPHEAPAAPEPDRARRPVAAMPSTAQPAPPVPGAQPASPPPADQPQPTPPRPSTHRVLPLEPPPPAVLGALQLPARKGGSSAAVLALPDAQPSSQPAPLLASALAAPLPAAASLNPAIVQPTAAVSTPQDFVVLIDRLVAARESALPHSATLAVAHAEFGQVELRFASDGGGLSVALSSPDPDFARVIQTAVMPLAASAETGTPPRGQGGQSAGTFDQGSSQSHGQAGGQQAGHRDSPARYAAQRRPDPSGTPRGIFA